MRFMLVAIVSLRRWIPSAQRRELQARTAKPFEILVEAEQPPAALDRHGGQVGIHPEFRGGTLMIRQLEPERLLSGGEP